MTAQAETAMAARTAPASPLLLLLKLRTVIALVALLVFFSFTIQNFLTVPSVLIMLKHVAIVAFLGIGMTFVIITAGIDLSVGSIVGLSGMVAGYLLTQGIALDMLGVTIYPNVFEIVLIALAVGTFVGAINGVLVTRFGVAPFIATLGVLYAARGVALLISGGATFPNLVGKAQLENTGFPLIGADTPIGPPSIYLMLALALIAWFIARFTPLGRQIYAVGGNERAAELSGVNVRRVKMFVYMFSGFCAAITGLVIASQLVAAHPATGETFELNAIAAAVLGGTSLAGGRGSIWGTMIGACVISVLRDGMVMMNISSFWQMVITGSVIVAAVIVDQAQRKMQLRAALRQQRA